ncbi:hypothetical protein BD560DRAFT_486560 [Blakeslea trispora]|nr:hypothetical protein BD560DRAFT_486560 [Blakeslea trispora]
MSCLDSFSISTVARLLDDGITFDWKVLRNQPLLIPLFRYKAAICLKWNKKLERPSSRQMDAMKHIRVFASSILRNEANHTHLLRVRHIKRTTTESIQHDLSDYKLCEVPGDSSDCEFACQEMVQGRGNCIFGNCYCTEETEIGKCEDDDHESCDALCQDMSPSLIGFCMDDQCNCIS